MNESDAIPAVRGSGAGFAQWPAFYRELNAVAAREHLPFVTVEFATRTGKVG